MKIQLQLEKVANECTTGDIWSTSSRSFFGYTCHWINDHFESKSAALAFTFLKINEIIAEIHNE